MKEEKGKWKIIKFWSDIADKNDDYNSMIKGWKYEIAYWDHDGVIYDEEYFDDKEEAKLYFEECKNDIPYELMEKK